MKRMTIIITLVTVVALAGSMVWAGPGRGFGRGGGGGGGQFNNLTDEQKTQLETERKAFFEATQDLRQEMRSKQFELKSILAKKEVDVEKAKKVQAEISQLRTQLGQKRIDHLVNLKKIDPNLDGRFMGRQGRGGKGGRGGGWGRHQGRGMGFGGNMQSNNDNFQRPRGWNY